MPITQAAQVVKFAELSGAVFPAALAGRLDQAGDDPAAVRREGIAIAAELGADLLAAGAPGLHFFTQNRSTATLAIWERVRPRA
jgi:methylenetetrahydrofolate reductase (NADPH)